MEFIAGRSFTKQRKQFLQGNDKLYNGMKFHKKNMRPSPESRNYQDGKDVLVEEYRQSPAFAGYDIFAPIDLIERYMEDAIFRFHETKKK